MDGSINRIRQSLTVIGSIKPNYTLNVRDMTLMPHKSISSATKRLLLRENRHKTIDTIESVIDESIPLLLKELDLLFLLKNTRPGLLNLKETYEGDLDIIQRIESCLTRVENVCVRFEHQLIMTIEQIPRFLELLKTQVTEHEHDNILIRQTPSQTPTIITPITRSPTVITPITQTPEASSPSVITPENESPPPTPPSTPRIQPPETIPIETIHTIETVKPIETGKPVGQTQTSDKWSRESKRSMESKRSGEEVKKTPKGTPYFTKSFFGIQQESPFGRTLFPGLAVNPVMMNPNTYFSRHNLHFRPSINYSQSQKSNLRPEIELEID